MSEHDARVEAAFESVGWERTERHRRYLAKQITAFMIDDAVMYLRSDDYGPLS